MSSYVTGEAGSGFRLRRLLGGVFSDTDPAISAQLDELNEILSRSIFDPDAEAGRGPAAGLDPVNVLDAELAPKRAVVKGGQSRWARGSLIEQLDRASEDDDKITLGEYIRKTSGLLELDRAFDELLQDRWPTLPPNTQAVLAERYAGIRNYVVAYAYLFKNIKKIQTFKNFALGSPEGAARVVGYAAVSAGRDIIKRNALDVTDFDDDDSEIVKDTKNAIDKGTLLLSGASFEHDFLEFVNDQIFDSSYLKLIDAASWTVKVPKALRSDVVEYLKQVEATTKVELKSSNAPHFIAHYLAELNGVTPSPTTGPYKSQQTDKDFDVEIIVDDRSTIVVSKAAVNCAAQLFYSMVTGDELNVLGAVDFFTRRYLLRGGVEVTDGRLRDDLQEYVFSNRFTDLKTGEALERTRPSERQVFYRQVFNTAGPNVSDLIANEDFPRLWKILMLESADYLERAQESPNPVSYVSRQKVMQAVEDLQYNLSTHCTGMANVITPMIYAEVNFVIRKIFMHQEVLKQVAPIGGTWWRVVERLLTEMNHSRPRATVLYNKARYGHEIMKAIADYDPATFQRDADFSAFIGGVDAFITTQSILQHALKATLNDEDGDEEAQNGHAIPAPVGMAAPPASNGSSPSDDWDF